MSEGSDKRQFLNAREAADLSKEEFMEVFEHPEYYDMMADAGLMWVYIRTVETFAKDSKPYVFKAQDVWVKENDIDLRTVGSIPKFGRIVAATLDIKNIGEHERATYPSFFVAGEKTPDAIEMEVYIHD